MYDKIRTLFVSLKIEKDRGGTNMKFVRFLLVGLLCFKSLLPLEKPQEAGQTGAPQVQGPDYTQLATALKSVLDSQGFQNDLQVSINALFAKHLLPQLNQNQKNQGLMLLQMLAELTRFGIAQANDQTLTPENEKRSQDLQNAISLFLNKLGTAFSDVKQSRTLIYLYLQTFLQGGLSAFKQAGAAVQTAPQPGKKTGPRKASRRP